MAWTIKYGDLWLRSFSEKYGYVFTADKYSAITFEDRNIFHSVVERIDGKIVPYKTCTR